MKLPQIQEILRNYKLFLQRPMSYQGYINETEWLLTLSLSEPDTARIQTKAFKRHVDKYYPEYRL